MCMRKKILAVDDDPINLTIMEELLGELYDLGTAQSGEEALELAEKLRPDLVLMDIAMPGADGYETCRRMRKRESLKHTKIVLVSAKAMVAERLRGYAAGADDYVTKPFDHAELLAKINVFLRLKSMEEMDTLKTEFLILMSHETRTPLTKLLLMAEMLAGEVPLPKEAWKHFASLIQETSEQLRELFDLGLQYCTLRAGQACFHAECFDAESALRATTEDLRAKAVKSGSSIVIARCEGTEMESSPESVGLVMRLVIAYALERCKGEVRVELESDDAEVRLVVRAPIQETDAGAVHVLLEPFRSPDVNRHSSGAFLNLPLAAELIRHLQGTMDVSVLEDGELQVQATFPRCVDLSEPEWDLDKSEEARAA